MGVSQLSQLGYTCGGDGGYHAVVFRRELRANPIGGPSQLALFEGQWDAKDRPADYCQRRVRTNHLRCAPKRHDGVIDVDLPRMGFRDNRAAK